MRRRPRYPELSSRRSDGKPSDLFNGPERQLEPRSTERLPLRSCPLQAGLDPLGDAGPFKFGDRGEDVHLQPPSRGCGINAFLKGDKRYAEHAEFIEQRDEMLQVSAEPVESPADQHIDSTTPGIFDEAVQCRTPIPRRPPTGG